VQEAINSFFICSTVDLGGFAIVFFDFFIFFYFKIILIKYNPLIAPNPAPKE
jgi:hypothetical protein